MSTPSQVTTHYTNSLTYSWYMVILLTVIYVFSFIDRFILGLLIEPIKADLNLTDTQVGLLLGPAFALFYAIMGLPLGWMADRYRRTWIIAGGLTVWSIATAGSGLISAFGLLFVARMAVGAGEATLSPCAMSLIADSFPKEKRGKPIAVYSTAISLGGGIAALAGAEVIRWATKSDSIHISGLGDLEPWRLSLLAVGLPGLLLVPFVLLLKEPKRQVDTIVTEKSDASYGEVFRYISARWKAFAGFLTVFCYTVLIGYSTSWGAATFSRTWGWSPIEFGQALGIIFIVFGPICVSFGGWLSDRLFRKGHTSAPLTVGLIGVPIMTIGAIAWPLMPSAELALFPLTIMVIGVAISSATGVTALLNIIPSDIRAQSIAGYYMITGLIGLGVGPLSIGLLNDYLFGTENLRYSMALLPAVFGIPTLILTPWILKKYRLVFADANRHTP